MKSQRQPFPFLALLLGLLIGVGGGLGYSWFVNPVKLVNIAPSQLVAEDQQAYIVMVSLAYLQDQRLDRAQQRLEWVGLSDPAQAVAQQADNAYLRGADLREVQALTALAQALGANPLAAEVFSGTTQPTPNPLDGSPTATFESMASITPTPDVPTVTPTLIIPTATPTPDRVLETDFNLVELSFPLCDEEYPEGLLEIYVEDSEGLGLAGLEIQVMWEGQTDRFFTGLKPDIDAGYADFTMEPNKVYTVSLVGLAEEVLGIDSTPCVDTERTPSYVLVFAPAPDLESTEESP